MRLEDSPLDLLKAEIEQINPAIILAEKLMRRNADALLSVEEVAEAERTLDLGASEIEQVEFHHKAFLQTPASAVDYVPIGF